MTPCLYQIQTTRLTVHPDGAAGGPVQALAAGAEGADASITQHTPKDPRRAGKALRTHPLTAPPGRRARGVVDDGAARTSGARADVVVTMT